MDMGQPRHADLRLGFLGSGAIAAEHARALAHIECSFTIVAGPDGDQVHTFAAAHGFARHTTRIEDVFEAGDVDAVVVASPNAVHAEQTLAAMRAGKHVLCEVPLAMSAASAEEVAATADANPHLVAMVCHTQRFWAPVVHLRDLVVSEQLHMHQLVHLTAMLRRDNIGWTGVRRTWVDSLVWHHGAHAVDTALWLLDDEAADVTAHGGHRHPKTGLPLDITIGIRTESGSLATAILSYNSLLSISELIAIAQEDAFRMSGGSLSGSRESMTFGTADEMQSAAMEAQDGLFVRAILDGAAPSPTPTSVLSVYRVLQEAANQIGRGRPTGQRASTYTPGMGTPPGALQDVR